MSMFGDKLSIKVGASTQNAERKISSVKEKLGNLSRKAISTATSLAGLGNRADEAADDIAETGRNADRTSRSLLGLAGAAATTKLSFGSLSVATAAGLAVSMATLATAMAPVVAGFAAVTAGAGALLSAFGALLGAGLLAWGEQLASQMQGVSSATEALSKVAKRLKKQLIPIIRPLGEAFVPLLQDAAVALPAVVQAMVNAVGSTEAFRRALRGFGGVVARVLPALTGFMFDIARKALPIAKRFFGFLLNNGGAAFRGIMASVQQLAPKFNAFLDALIKAAPVLLKFGTNVMGVLLPALTDLLGVATGVMNFINGLSPGLRKAAIAGMLLAPVITALTLKIAGIVSLLAGSGGLISLIGGSAGIGAALTALTGPVGIAILAIGALAAAWAANLGNMRTKTVRWASDMASLINGTFGNLKASMNDDTPYAITPGQEKARMRHLSKGDASAAGAERAAAMEAATPSGGKAFQKYQAMLEKHKTGDTWLNPATWKSQGQSAGTQFARGVKQGMSQTQMKASIIKDKQNLKSLRYMFKNADSLRRKKELLDKIQAITNPKNMNQSKPHSAIQRMNLGAKTTPGQSRRAGMGMPLVRSTKNIQQSSTRIKNVSQTFSKAVDKFATAVQDMEVVVTLDDKMLEAKVQGTAESVLRAEERRSSRNTGSNPTPR